MMDMGYPGEVRGECDVVLLNTHENALAERMRGAEKRFLATDDTDEHG
jgi:hypothetical protein